MSISDMIQKADWTHEKHVPVIEIPETVEADKPIDVKVSVGKEISHPNTGAHHIAWIKLFFIAEDGKFPVQLGDFEFSVHGSEQSPAQVQSEPYISARVSIGEDGKLMAMSYCNLHGLWQGEQEVSVR